MEVKLCLLACLLSVISGLRVLVVHPIYAGSHVLTLQSVTEKLLLRGHHVTTVKFRDTALPPLRTAGHRNFTLVELSVNNSRGELPLVTAGQMGQFRLPLEMIWGKGQDLLWTIKMMALSSSLELQNIHCTKVLGKDVGYAISKDPTPYDIALVDLMFNECGLGLAHRLGVPAVGYWAFSFSAGWQEYTSQPAPPSYVPSFMTGLPSVMTLPQRLYNMVARIMGVVFMHHYHNHMDNLILRLSPSTPPSRDMLANLSGMLLNTDMVLDYPRPQPPTFINIGGIQVQENPGPLPENIKAFIQSAREGVVLFTMGFIFDSTAVPKSMIQNLFAAFERLPQKVIFKYDMQEGEVSGQSGVQVPPNVLVLPWVPQQAILAHPATKVFITHCGMHGVLEAIYHQVPMVGMPVFIDQIDVITRMQEKGIGLEVNKGASADDIHAAIVKVRDDPSYRRQMASLSQLMKDRRTSPMQDSVWLVEYVARTKGAQHLKLASRHLGFLSYHSIDTVLILGSLLLVLLLLLCRLLPNILTIFLPGFITNSFFSTEAEVLEGKTAKTVRPEEERVGQEALAAKREGQGVYKRTGPSTDRREDNLRTL